MWLPDPAKFSGECWPNWHPSEMRLEGKGAEVHVREALALLPTGAWVSGGTALGLYRDGAIIPWDTDLDFCVLAEWGEGWPRDEVAGAFCARGYDVARTMDYDGQPSQLALWHRGLRVMVDIYPIYSGLEDGWGWMLSGEVCVRKPLEMLRDVGKVTTAAGEFPMPRPVEDYLAWRYGPGWRESETWESSGWKAAPARVVIG